MKILKHRTLRRLTFFLILSSFAITGRSQQPFASIDFNIGTSLNFLYFSNKKEEDGALGGGSAQSVSDIRLHPGIVVRCMMEEKLATNLFTRFGMAFRNFHNSLTYDMHSWTLINSNCYYWNEDTRIAYSNIEMPLTLGFYFSTKHSNSVSFGFIPEFVVANKSIWRFNENCNFFFPPDTPYVTNTSGEKKLKAKGTLAFELGFQHIFPLKANIAIIVEERSQYSFSRVIEDPPLKQVTFELAIGALFNWKKK